MNKPGRFLKSTLSIVCILSCSQLASQDRVGSGRALLFDGIDDYATFGNIYDDLVFPITISAWINQQPGNTLISPIFVSQDNAPVYNGFWFCVNGNNVFFEYGDGRGENHPAFRRGKTASIPGPYNRWIHVAAVVNGESSIELYVNGQNVGGYFTGNTTLPMASDFPNDVAKIGVLNTNSVIHHFKGQIDEVVVFNRALSEAEIRERMCRRLYDDEPGLIGYWTFDETSGTTLTDKSSNSFDGELKEGTSRVYSGAPIGDESAFLYTSSWTEAFLCLDDFFVKNISGDPYGIHIYRVDDVPSQTAGLETVSSRIPYYGVFSADGDLGNTFDLASECNFFQRTDNAESPWMGSTTVNGIVDRLEVVREEQRSDLDVHLGPDQKLCDKSEFTIHPIIDETEDISFLWSTGSMSSTLSVTESGLYSLIAFANCSLARDTIQVIFAHSPSEFSLGIDEDLCKMEERTLFPYLNVPTDVMFTWHDGSMAPFFTAQQYGTYWVKVFNECGSVGDTIAFTQRIENLSVELGEDKTICMENAMVLQPVVSNQNAEFTWSDGSGLPTLSVTDYGEYWVRVSTECATASDTISIAKRFELIEFDLGKDTTLCLVQPIAISPFPDASGLEFTWQDGSKQSSFLLEDYGTYWLSVTGKCGAGSDTVRYLPPSARDVLAPNVITPNDDGLNDQFTIESETVNVNLEIFNRWGGKVYASGAYKNEWNAKDVPGGIYYYILSTPCMGEKKGTLHVLK